MNKHEVTQVLAVLSSVWTNHPISPEMQQAYFWALADEQADVIQEAARQMMKTSKWFPKPSELIALAKEIESEQIRSGQRVLPAPVKQAIDPDQIRRVAAKCREAGINNPYVEAMLAELDQDEPDQLGAA